MHMQRSTMAAALAVAVMGSIGVLMILWSASPHQASPTRSVDQAPQRPPEGVVSVSEGSRALVEATSTSVVFSLEVVDVEGLPVVGATARSSLAQAAVEADARGMLQLTFEHEQPEPPEVVVSHADYQTCSVRLLLPLTRVTLSRGCMIRGSVRSELVGIDYSEVRVFAYAVVRPSPGQIQDYLSGELPNSATVQVVRADPEGRFVFSGLDPAHDFAIEAAGGGVICPSPRFRVPCGAEDVHLEVSWACAGIVFLRGPHGEDLALPPSYPIAYDVSVRPYGPGNSGFDARLLPLAGVHPELLGRRPNVLLICGVSPDGRLGMSAGVKVLGLGLGSATQEVPLGPLGMDLPTTEIRLPRAPESFGAIEVAFEQDACAAATAGGALVLTDGYGRTEHVPAVFEGNRGMVTGLPSGTYTASFRSRHRYAPGGSRTIEVRDGETALFTVEGSDVGCIRFVLEDAAGVEYSGRFSALVFRKKDQGLRPDGRRSIRDPCNLNIGKPPYSLGPIESGPYILEMGWPRTPQELVEFEVVPGEERVVRITCLSPPR